MGRIGRLSGRKGVKKTETTNSNGCFSYFLRIKALGNSDSVWLLVFWKTGLSEYTWIFSTCDSILVSDNLQGPSAEG